MTGQSMLPGCHVCDAHPLRILDGFGDLKQVTSDCRPWQGGGMIAVCNRCGTVQKPISPAWERAAAEIYAGYEIYSQGGGAEQRVFDLQTGAAASRSSRIVDAFIRLTPLLGQGRLLDVGCGNGALLAAFSAAMPGWTLAGNEVDGKYRSRIEGIAGVERLYTGDVKNIPGRFDVISMVHCLEHIPHPINFLLELREKMAADGVLLIEVPNLAENPFDLLIADHCSHFLPSSLRHVVSAAGYRITSLSAEVVPKELCLTARLGDVVEDRSLEVPDPTGESLELVSRSLRWLEEFLRIAMDIGAGPVGIFGTSIAATWLAQHLSGRVGFFVDEDANRVGGTHLRLPIVVLRDVAPGAKILCPLPPKVAARVAERLATPGIIFVVPPQLPAHRDELARPSVTGMTARAGVVQ